MRKPETQEIQWAHESYRHLSRGVFGDSSQQYSREVHEYFNDETQEEVENQFQKLAERFTEFFGHPSKI